ncbi:MAG TPA: DnaJ domain-containing protein [Blastocatellia bacterium]|nr:DnaJ domain-containing protein [Blastocatellia bacterium]
MKKYDSKKDYYEVLGVSEEATDEEIDKAFRAGARTRHPDGGGSEEEMKSLNEARDILRDHETRKAYDAERRPPQITYGTSAAYDPDAASRAGTLKIPVADEDFAGLVMGAATCFVIGLPLLLLIEFQWVFFLWPLRVLSLGALMVGVVMSHSALALKHRQMRKKKPGSRLIGFIAREALFWAIVIACGGMLVIGLYFS